jgi:hypothetical protein
MGYFRHPRTTQERRNAAGLETDRREFREDIGFAIRLRRGAGSDSMVTSWDDIPVAARKTGAGSVAAARSGGDACPCPSLLPMAEDARHLIAIGAPGEPVAPAIGTGVKTYMKR